MSLRSIMLELTGCGAIADSLPLISSPNNNNDQDDSKWRLGLPRPCAATLTHHEPQMIED